MISLDLCICKKSMNIEHRKTAFVRLGQWMRDVEKESLEFTLRQAHNENQWFTPENSLKAIRSLGEMLDEKDLGKWLANYEFKEHEAKRIGIIMAGNIPLVGFHDLLCVLLSGNTGVVKMSKDDKVLLPFVLEKLFEIEPALKPQVELADKLENYDAAIATGSNNSAMHFAYYFRKVPHIIRRNRNAVAVISGNESPEELAELGHDVFDYFGLGCRNVSQIYLPQDFDIAKFYEPLQQYQDIINHNKYANNHTFQKAIHIMNLVSIYDNDFLILVEHEQIASPTATCHYQRYTDIAEVEKTLAEKQDQLQCVIAQPYVFENLITTPLGQGQQPKLWDYADGVDTMAWVGSL